MCCLTFKQAQRCLSLHFISLSLAITSPLDCPSRPSLGPLVQHEACHRFTNHSPLPNNHHEPSLALCHDSSPFALYASRTRCMLQRSWTSFIPPLMSSSIPGLTLEAAAQRDGDLDTVGAASGLIRHLAVGAAVLLPVTLTLLLAWLRLYTTAPDTVSHVHVHYQIFRDRY